LPYRQPFRSWKCKGRCLRSDSGKGCCKLDFAAALWRHQKTALECFTIGLCQFASHVRIDQIRFGGFECSHVVWFREGAILHSDLLLFRQRPEQISNQQQLVNRF
jgi:hypothetical protein